MSSATFDRLQWLTTYQSMPILGKHHTGKRKVLWFPVKNLDRGDTGVNFFKVKGKMGQPKIKFFSREISRYVIVTFGWWPEFLLSCVHASEHLPCMSFLCRRSPRKVFCFQAVYPYVCVSARNHILKGL